MPQNYSFKGDKGILSLCVPNHIVGSPLRHYKKIVKGKFEVQCYIENICI